jgi:hypothetical protein
MDDSNEDTAAFLPVTSHELPPIDHLSTTRKTAILLSLWLAVMLAGFDMTMYVPRPSLESV